jgi:membrane associated rhomboid family serine protease
MALTEKKLTSFGKEATDGEKIFDALLVSVFFISLCWFFFLMDEYLGYHFKSFGLQPRAIEGLRGIFTIHFLHSDFQHIGQNSLGLLVLNTFLFYFYRKISFKVFLVIFLVSPCLLWLIGREGNHIGASVLIYGEFAFLLISGLIRNNPLLMRVSLVVILYYGSLVWYIFPVDQKISWEGHACGFLTGALCALLFRKEGPKRKVYQFELEPELPDDENAYWKLPNTDSSKPVQSETTVTIKYHYKEKDHKGSDI